MSKRIRNRKRPALVVSSMIPTCPNCGEKGPHFVPPSLGERGFFSCLPAALEVGISTRSPDLEQDTSIYPQPKVPS